MVTFNPDQIVMEWTVGQSVWVIHDCDLVKGEVRKVLFNSLAIKGLGFFKYYEKGLVLPYPQRGQSLRDAIDQGHDLGTIQGVDQ